MINLNSLGPALVQISQISEIIHFQWDNLMHIKIAMNTVTSGYFQGLYIS